MGLDIFDAHIYDCCMMFSMHVVFCDRITDIRMLTKLSGWNLNYRYKAG